MKLKKITNHLSKIASYFLLLVFIGYFMFVLSSCLTCDKKEYTFEFTGKGSGKLTIIFYNIKSAKENGLDVSEKDFSELTSEYIEGNKLSEEYPNAKVRQAKIYEKDGILCGKVTIYFDKIEDVESKSNIVVRAHGISPDVRSRLLNKDVKIYDATCPYVIKIQKLVKKKTQ